jgi:dihydroorotate dehydrogenase
MQRAKNSGVIVNTGTTDWCSESGMGGISGYALKRITLNAITNLLNKQTVFLE